MPTYGLLEDGFLAKPASVIKAELEAALKAGPLGESAGTEEDGSIPAASVAGQLVTLILDPISSLWELAEEVVTGLDPAGAVDAQLDAVCALTGTLREDEAYSTVTAVCTGTPGTVLPIGRVATVEDAGSRFASDGPVTITLLSSWVALTAYVVGDRRTNASRCYQCITAGTSAASGGPTTTAADITDATAHWTYLGEGTGAIDNPMTAEEVGAIGATARTLTEIATPVSGWQSVMNLADADLGQDEEGNAALRFRREEELSGSGSGTADAIRAAVLDVADVEACKVFFNDSDATDADGLPPHSVEVLVLDGDNDEIAAAIWQEIGGSGIYTHGGVSRSVTDSEGNAQTVRFSRPTAVTIWIIAGVTYDPATFPIDLTAGRNLIKGALVTYGDTYPVGLDVRASALSAKIFTGPTSTDPGATATPGVLDVTSLLIGTVNPPVASTTITITSRQIATFDTSRITVNLASGTP